MDHPIFGAAVTIDVRVYWIPAFASLGRDDNAGWGRLKKDNRPLFIGSGPEGRPYSSLPSPSNRGGRRADKAQCPDCSGRVSGLRRTMGAQRCTRASRRANGHLRAYALPTVGPHQELFVPGGLFPRSPVGRDCVYPYPQVPSRSPPSRRLMNAPLELGPGWAQHNYAESEVKRYFTKR